MQSQHTLHKSDLMRWVPNPLTRCRSIAISLPNGQQLAFLLDPSPQLLAEVLWDCILRFTSDPSWYPQDTLRIQTVFE